MDRAQFLLPFTLQHLPHLPCPKCQVGQLTIDAKNFLQSETAASKKDREHDAWEPDWIHYVFSCVFDCSRKDCGNVVSCSGAGGVKIYGYVDEENDWVQDVEDYFYPRYFHPSLVLMDIPKKCPVSVGEHLRESFALFFSSPSAALNAARSAVESLLTELGVKRFEGGKGKRRSISLHRRIQLLPAKHKEVTELLLAVKWLGNAGSHDSDEIDQGDVRVAYDLLEHVLSELFEGKGKKLKAIAKKVNAKKGPLR